MGVTHFSKVSGITGLAVGAKGEEVDVVTAEGKFTQPAAHTQTTVGAAGGATALPATPSGYLVVEIEGTEYVIPYFAKA